MSKLLSLWGFLIRLGILRLQKSDMRRVFISSLVAPNHDSEAAWWFAFVGNQLLHLEDPQQPLPQLISLEEVGLNPVRTQCLGSLDDRLCYVAELPAQTIVPSGMRLQELRKLYGILDEDLFALSGRALQIKEWDRTHQFCGHCGTPTVQAPNERAKQCPKCHLRSYPRLSPAVIVLISRGDELLLAHAHRMPPGLYSVLAGFVEPGESLEDTIIREVKEEAGIEVQDIRYFGSQPWPFPNSLMIGFTATYASGELSIDPHEIADAAWFHKQNLPEIPPPLSIARKLIDWFVQT
jgi:NAD+ diphosphatase